MSSRNMNPRNTQQEPSVEDCIAFAKRIMQYGGMGHTPNEAIILVLVREVITLRRAVAPRV